MKKLSLFIAALAASALVSCTDQIVPNTDEHVNPVASKVFTATTEGPATKTALEKEGDSYIVNWQNGDQIAIVDAAATPNVGVYSTTSTTTQGDFTFESGAEAATPPYKAWYPAEVYNDGAPALPATQQYAADNITGASMYAESGNNSLQFKNLGGILRLNVSTTAGGKSVRKIIVTAEQGMSGAIGNAATLVGDSYIAAVSGTAGVTLDCGESGVAIGTEPTSFHIAVPANEYTGLKITVETTDGMRQTRSLKSDRNLIVGRSSITDVTIGFNDLDGGSYTDLSASATANTYIVSSAGKYKFKATVKGNGGLDPVTGTTATPITGISGVTVLWEVGSVPGQAIKYNDSAYDIFTDGSYVYFNTPDVFAAGDAYVAVFKDGAGGTAGIYDKDVDEILWSWLIWTTVAPGSVLYNNNKFLDRNIGSVTSGSFSDGGYTAGFSYQWGRPYPFASAYKKQYTPYSYFPGRTTVFDFPNFSSGTTVEYSVAHPTSFFQPPRGNWMSEAAFKNNMWSDDVKTIYDPSPIGWKVPSKEQLTGITSAITFYGAGFIGTCGSDFGYGNPGSVLLWSSSCDNYNTVWANAYGSITSTQVDVYFRSGMQIRPVEDVSSLTYADLSATETANSYIVPGPGNYKFKATVKGNGAADLAGVSRNTNASEIASAGLVWASYGTSVAPVEGEMLYGLRYQDGYVYFRVPETFRQGNAVVAIKNSGGTVLWSWHLWFTDADIDGSAQTYPSGAVLMDRNLGALSATYNSSNTADWGLMYQWGRKDPFHNSKEPSFISGYISSSNASTVYRPAILGTAENYVTAYQGNSTVAYVNQFPQWLFTSWYISNTQSDQTEWAYDMTDDLWAADKTIFDPCPAGWQVPDKAVWEGSFVTSLEAASLSNNGFTVSGIRYPNTAVRLPNATYINGTKRNNGGLILENQSDYHIFVWAFNGQLHKEKFNYEYAGGSTPPVTTGTYPNRPIRSSYATESDFYSALSSFYSGIPSHAQSYFSRNRAGAVRCVRVE